MEYKNDNNHNNKMTRRHTTYTRHIDIRRVCLDLIWSVVLTHKAALHGGVDLIPSEPPKARFQLLFANRERFQSIVSLISVMHFCHSHQRFRRAIPSAFGATCIRSRE